MISMSFTGNTIEDVTGQMLTFALLLHGKTPATMPIGTTTGPEGHAMAGEVDMVADAVALAKADVATRVADATGSIEGAQRKRRTKAEMEAMRAAEVEAHRTGPGPQTAPVEPARTGEVVQFLRDAKAATAPEADPATALFGEAEMPTEKPTFEDLKTALREVCEAEGKGVEAAKALMKTFAVQKLSALAECEWLKFIGDAKAICHVRA